MTEPVSATASRRSFELCQRATNAATRRVSRRRRPRCRTSRLATWRSSRAAVRATTPVGRQESVEPQLLLETVAELTLGASRAVESERGKLILFRNVHSVAPPPPRVRFAQRATLFAAQWWCEPGHAAARAFCIPPRVHTLTIARRGPLLYWLFGQSSAPSVLPRRSDGRSSVDFSQRPGWATPFPRERSRPACRPASPGPAA
jgi:hypothetical protein